MVVSSVFTILGPIVGSVVSIYAPGWRNDYCEAITDLLPDDDASDSDCFCRTAYGTLLSLTMVATCTAVDTFTLTDFDYDDAFEAHTSVCQHTFDGVVDNFVDSIYGNFGRNGIPVGVKSTCDFGADGGSLTVESTTRTTVTGGFHNITTCSGEYTSPSATVPASCDCTTVGCTTVGQVALDCGDIVMPCFDLLEISDAFDAIV